MEEKYKQVVRLGNISFYLDENNAQAVINNIASVLRQKISKAKNYLRLLEQELRDIENLNFSTNRL